MVLLIRIARAETENMVKDRFIKVTLRYKFAQRTADFVFSAHLQSSIFVTSHGCACYLQS